MTDYALNSVVYLAFTTRAFATGIPTALAGSPTLEIYENDSTSPIVEGASKLVLTQNLASINGFNLATITATTANGFEAGKTYHLILKTGTVDSVSVVGEVVGRFTLDASSAKAAIGTPVDLGGGTATVAGNLTDIESQTDDIGAAGAGLTAIWSVATRTLTAIDEDSTTIDLDATIIAAVPSAATIAAAVWDLDATTHQTQGTFGQAIGDPGADANTIFGAVVTGAAGATIAADIIVIDGIVDDILLDTAEIGTAGAGLTNVTINGLSATALKDFFDTDSTTTYAGAVAGSVVKEIADNAGGASLTVQDIVDGVWDEAIANHLDPGSTGLALNGASAPSAATVAAAVWDLDATAHQTQGTFGQAIGDPVANSNTIWGATAGVTGVDLQTIVDAFWDEVLAGHVGAGSGAATMTAIKAKTDSLTFTVAAKVDSNIRTVNGVAVDGTGTTADPWGPV